MLSLNIFKQKLVDTISQSGLTIDGIYFVMKDVMNEVADLYNQQLFQDRKEAEAAAQQAKDANKEDKTAAASLI